MHPTVIRVDGQIFLLSTGRQPDSLAPVWALIGHLTPHTHAHTHRTVLRGSAPPRSAGV